MSSLSSLPGAQRERPRADGDERRSRRITVAAIQPRDRCGFGSDEGGVVDLAAGGPEPCVLRPRSGGRRAVAGVLVGRLGVAHDVSLRGGSVVAAMGRSGHAASYAHAMATRASSMCPRRQGQVPSISTSSEKLSTIRMSTMMEHDDALDRRVDDDRADDVGDDEHLEPEQDHPAEVAAESRVGVPGSSGACTPDEGDERPQTADNHDGRADGLDDPDDVRDRLLVAHARAPRLRRGRAVTPRWNDMPARCAQLARAPSAWRSWSSIRCSPSLTRTAWKP